MKSTHNITIQGQKGGSQSSSYTPVEQSDDLLSDAKLKMLVAVCEGETEGAVTAQQIYLNDTVLANEDGTYNFTGVNWEFRNGTQDQEYIQGMPEIDNELSVGVAVTTSSPWTHQFTDTSLDAIRIKLSLPAQYQYKDNGDMVGTVTEYAIDLSTDGGSYETVVSDKFDGKTTSEYQRDHRINLTRGGTTWAIRVRRITADSTSTKLVNAFKVYSYAEVVDSKLRYPNTALLYVEVDAGQFTSGAPKVTVKMKGKLIRVPDNYDPDTREYTGTWDGSFKMAYSNNPAWVFYDIILDKISGMGNRIDASMIDKWELYQIAEYCDEMVSDGAGGKEPRFTCNAYVQSQEDAFTVLQDFAAIFRGITFWGNSQIIISADAPVDGPEWTYTAANVVDGLFSYAGGSYKNRYTSCLVSYSDPQNHYSDTTEAVYDADLLSRYGVQQMSLTAIGCTSQSEAHRRGRWALLSNAKDGTVSFSVGLDGHIPLPASIIGVADPYRAGKTNGGRISSVSGLNLTLDRAITFGAGDRLIVNLPDGTAQTRTIAGVSDDKKTVTVSTAFKTTPVAGAVWIIDSDNLAIQQFRVTSITDNDDGTFTVAAVQYDPDKYSYIDDGVMVESAPVTVTPATVMSAPGNITVNEVSHTSQGISLSSLQVAWDAVKGAVKYSAQWRRDSGEWINAGSVSSQGFTVNNIYAGIYEVRVRSVNSSGVSSPWGASDAVTLTGKQGKPPVPLSLTASDNTVFGIDLSWTFGDGSDDGLKTTLMVSTLSDHSDEALLADIPYPQSTYSLTGLASGVVRYFRAAFTDKSGNQSEWTDYVTGQSSSNASDVLSYISGEISKTDLGKDLTTEIDAKADQSTVQQQISDASQQAQAAIDKATESSNSAISDANKAIEQANNAISTEIGDRIAAVQSEASARADALLNEENARKADINTVQTLIQNDSESLAQQIAQVAAGTGEQFDPYKIWYFDDKSVDGWSGNGDPTVTDDGWLKPADSDSEFATSPSGLGINGMAYQFIKARLKKVGSPEWVGEILWKDQSGDFSDQQSMVVTEPEYDENNIATLTVHDIPWQSMTVDQFRLNLTSSQSDDNYIIFDWISVGRPTPGAGMAALQQEQTARVEADAAEATNRNTLAAQLRGPYTGTDASQVTSGLIYSEQQLRISGDKAEATARQALETKIDNSVSEIDQSLDTLNTATQANASDISNLKSSLQTTNNNVAQKADASALQATQSTVSSQGNTLTSQGNQIASLQAGITQGANLVPNPGMIGNASGWSFDSMGTDGNRVYVAASWEYAPNSAQFPVAAGDVLTISADLWTDSNSAINLRIRYDGPNMTNNASSVYQNNSPATGSWFTATGKSTVPDGATIAQIQMDHPSGTVRLSNPVVTIQVASADALNSLSSTVKNQGDTISSQGNQITNLQNSVAGKADSSAVSSLSSTVSSQGNTISSQGSRLTSLENSITVGDNIVPNPTMLNNASGWSGSPTSIAGYAGVISANSWQPASPKFPVNAGDIIDFSLMCKTDAAISGLAWGLRFDGPNLNNSTAYVGSADYNAGETKHVTGTITVPNGATTAQLQPNTGSTVQRTIYNVNVTRRNAGVVANSSAISDLSNKVSQNGDKITSQANDISNLKSSLQTTNNNVAQKADASALQATQSTVSSQGNTLTSQGNQIASLQAGITQGANLVPNPGMTGNASGWGYSAVGTDGNRVYVSGSWEYSPNSASFPVAAGDVLMFSADLWTDSSSSISMRVRFDGPNMANNAWAVYQNGSPSTGSWFSATGKATVPAGATIAQIQLDHPSGTVRLSNPVVTIQVASADALNSLSSTVKNQGDTISSQGTQITNLQNSVAGKADSSAVSSLSSTVSSQGNTISSQGSAITAINASLSNGANIVPNPSMSSGGAGWSYTSTGSDSGRNYVAANYNYAPNSKQFAVNAGDTLVCSADLYIDSAMNVTLRIRFDGASVSNVAVGVASANLSANSWQTVTGSVTVPAGASLAQIQVVHGSGTARIANPSVFAQPVSVSAFNSLTATVNQQGNNISSQAQSISQLSSQTGSNSSAIQDTKSAVSSLQGTVSATWSLKVQADSKGNKTVAGIGLSSDSGTGSQFLVQADRFAMITGANGNITTPFAVSGGQTYINSAMIKNASIGSAKISDLQSDNYSGGTAGWKITKDGAAELNNVTVRGHIYASQGSIDNVTIGEDCTIEGKLSANNIDGDVSKMFYLKKGSTITIPATSIDRVIAIPTIYVFASAFVDPQSLHVTQYSCNARIQVNGSDVYTVSADSGQAYNLTANHFDLNVQSYSFSLAAGQSCTVGYAYYQPSGNMTRLMDYLMVVASKA